MREKTESDVRATTHTWQERVKAALQGRSAVTKGQGLAEDFTSFSSEYQAAVKIDTAVSDVTHLKCLVDSGDSQLSIRALSDEDPGQYELRLFANEGAFILSDVIPTLENLGLRVLDYFQRLLVAGLLL